MSRNVNWAAVAAKASRKSEQKSYPATNKEGGRIYYASQLGGKVAQLKPGDELRFC